MNSESYISYLNSLHNYNAQNSNAYGEKNVKNEFFPKIAVKVGLCSYIEKQLLNEEPHMLVLTGHAGDGKTSIMHQVLNEFGVEFDVKEKITDISFGNGKECRCIKDYSELNDKEKFNVLKECLELPNRGKYVFLVSNTGPLINFFGDLFQEQDKEEMRVQLIDAIDKNEGVIKNIGGYKINVINVATVDNTNFAVSFLSNILNKSLWEGCHNCNKKEYCHIYNNRNLILKNKQRVFEFLRQHYIWLVEHGTRLTIRSITEQIAYMITGGVSCRNVCARDRYKMLFFNLFFGYIGLKCNHHADCILAVKEARQCGYDQRRLRSDEKLLVDEDYDSLFGETLVQIIHEAHKKDGCISGWKEFLRRAYIFTNIVTNEVTISNDIEDIFSRQFERFLELRDNRSRPTTMDTNLIIDALSMIYTGKISDRNTREIPLTLNKESGLTQNVQLITGFIQTRRISIAQVITQDSKFNDKAVRCELKLKINSKILDNVLTLPILDYFEELRNGIISTNIDPQLSHGVESIKAQLVNEFREDEDDKIDIIILNNNTNEFYSLNIDSKNKIQFRR